MMSIRLAIAAALASIALPANAAITFTGSYAVAGDATDLSGLPAAHGGNRLSIGSDLFYDRTNDLFYGLTDRGPGGGVIDFAPRVNSFRLTTDSLTNAITGFSLVSTIVFTTQGGTPFSGLNPSLLNGNSATLGRSLDPEGLVRLGNGHFLVSDEYGPSVYEFDASGRQVRAFTTPENLIPRQADGTTNYTDGRPTITTGRQDNRGFEGLTVSADGKTAYAIMQDPLVNEGSNNDGRRSRNLRIVAYDVESGTAKGQYVYQLEAIADINGRIDGTANDFGATNQGRSIGASSITALSDGSLLVIERDNRGLGVDDPNGASAIGTKRVYRISLDGATDVSALSLAGSNALPAGVVPVGKQLYLDIQAALGANGLSAVEKLEGLSFGRILDDGSLSLFLVSDNDFSVTQNGAGEQFDVCTSGWGGTSSQVTLGSGCAAGQSLIPSMIYGFKVTGADAAGAVPEPQSWAMMITGFALAGAALRRRRTSTAPALRRPLRMR